MIFDSGTEIDPSEPYSKGLDRLPETKRNTPCRTPKTRSFFFHLQGFTITTSLLMPKISSDAKIDANHRSKDR